jgi:hypothetical protein
MDRQEEWVAFAGFDRIAAGAPDAVAATVAASDGAGVLVFDRATGRVVDLDLRGGPEAVAARYRRPDAAPRERGRPKLGVVAREVTLLPRHWDWLGGQPGGASAALRRLVDGAMRERESADRARRAAETGYRFMSALAGDLPGFEEASRALFAGDATAFAARIQAWPADVREELDRMLADAFAPREGSDR